MQIDPSTLVPISGRTLASGVPLKTDLYCAAGDGARPVLFCKTGDRLGPERLSRLSTTVLSLYIDRRGSRAYQQYLRSNWSEIVLQISDAAGQVSVVGDIVREVLGDEFRAGNTDSILSAARELAGCICDVIIEKDCLASELHEVLQHDYDTVTHSTNVALYCVVLARKLGFAAQDLRDIALGGLLHDIGKVGLDENLLQKPGQLTKLQYREIMRHPMIGFEKLVNHRDIRFPQLMMIYQHHERMDGTGYPVRVIAEEIHPWARICSIADAYTSLTSYRPYRDALDPPQALDQLCRAEGAFDSEMLACWGSVV